MILKGNRKIVYEELLRLGGGRVSCGMLAYMAGCSKKTVWRVVDDLQAVGLVFVSRTERGKPNLYEFP